VANFYWPRCLAASFWRVPHFRPRRSNMRQSTTDSNNAAVKHKRFSGANRAEATQLRRSGTMFNRTRKSPKCPRRSLCGAATFDPASD